MNKNVPRQKRKRTFWNPLMKNWRQLRRKLLKSKRQNSYIMNNKNNKDLIRLNWIRKTTISTVCKSLKIKTKCQKICEISCRAKYMARSKKGIIRKNRDASTKKTFLRSLQGFTAMMSISTSPTQTMAKSTLSAYKHLLLRQGQKKNKWLDKKNYKNRKKP